jgi:hypothetical protein
MFAAKGVISSSYLPASGYDPSAQAFFTATGITDLTIKDAVNTLVLSAKSNGWWTKCTTIYPMVGGTSTTCKYNLKDTTAYTLTEHGTISYASTGVTGNGSTGYLDTGLAANVLSQNDYHISFYSRSNINNTEVEIGSRGSNIDNDCFLEIRTSDTTYFAENSTVVNTINFLDTDSRGFYLGERTTSTHSEVYRNGTSKQTGGQTSAALNSQNIYICALNNNGTAAFFSTKECAFATAGLSLGTTLETTMYSDIQVFQTSLSRQV